MDGWDVLEEKVRRCATVHGAVNEASARRPFVNGVANLSDRGIAVNDLDEPVVLAGELVYAGEFLPPALAERRLEEKNDFHA